MSKTAEASETLTYRGRAVRERLTRLLSGRRSTLLLAILVASVILAILRPQFLNKENLTSVLMGMTYDLFMAMGMTLVLILGGIDLSVGSVLGLTGVVTTMLMSKHIGIELDPFLAVLIGLSVAALCGAVNGFGVAKLKIAPFIVTLAMLAIARGLATVLTSGWYISGLPDQYVVIGQGMFWGVPYPVFIALLVIVVFNYLLRQWKPLNQAFYIGSNPPAAALSGIRVALVTFFGYVISGLLSGMAAIFMTSRLAMGFFQFGLGSELNAIAAAVIGGASFAGGEGDLFGTFLAVLLIAVINNGFVLLRGDPNWKILVQGAIVFVAIAIDAYRRRKGIRE
jgi:ribose/xylose/arabinose/galactoside ABC-type transport system permease subunit